MTALDDRVTVIAGPIARPAYRIRLDLPFLAVACGWCDAAPGNRCTYPHPATGRPAPTEPHGPRITAATPRLLVEAATLDPRADLIEHEIVARVGDRWQPAGVRLHPDGRIAARLGLTRLQPAGLWAAA